MAEYKDTEQKREVASLQQMIYEHFPAEKFDGMITPVDGELAGTLSEAFEKGLDDEKILYDALRNLSWTQISVPFMCANPDGYVLLTHAAYTAFFAAWLLQSLTPEEENIVREFMIYCFDPGDLKVPFKEPFIAARFRHLNVAQRATVQSVLKHLLRYEPSKFVRDHAIRAVAFIEGIEK